MALANGDEVALARDLTSETLAARGNVLFGRVIDQASVEVLWETGKAQDTITATLLDKIVGVNAPQDAVTFDDGSNGVNSPEYRGTIVRRYTRQNNGAGTTVSFTLIRLLTNGQLLEVPTAAIESLRGQ